MGASVEVTWNEKGNILDSVPVSPGGRQYTVHTIKHGDTLYQWINTTRDEALAEFRETMAGRCDIQASIEPWTAEGYTTETDRTLFLWINPEKEMNAMLAAVLGAIDEQGSDR